MSVRELAFRSLQGRNLMFLSKYLSGVKNVFFICSIFCTFPNKNMQRMKMETKTHYLVFAHFCFWKRTVNGTNKEPVLKWLLRLRHALPLHVTVMRVTYYLRNVKKFSCRFIANIFSDSSFPISEKKFSYP